MLFIDDVEFCEEVRLIRQRERLWLLGLDPKSISGIFDRDDFRDLVAVCTEHPAYHVVSFLPSYVAVNYLEPTGIMFFLAEGNKDPRLAKCMSDKSAYWVPSTAKMRRQAFFPMIPGGESRDNPQLFTNALDYMWTSPFYHFK